jgi:hypothetical protein
MQKEAQQAKNSDKAQKLSIEADVLIKQKNELAKIKLWQK